jgi:hypothetical protein
VPLSEHEQRQLEAIERALYADDPKFAHTVRFTNPRAQGRRKIVGGGLLVALGLALLLGGAVLSVWYIGVLGFVIMLAGATRAYGGVRRIAGKLERPGTPQTRAPDPRRGADHSGFFERFEQRWRRRFDDS